MYLCNDDYTILHPSPMEQFLRTRFICETTFQENFNPAFDDMF